jgi:hypothetical protein
MSTTSDSPTPEAASTPSKSPLAAGDITKPAFKVTRSPFAPKIGGVSTGPLTGPMSIGASSALGPASATRPAAGASAGAPRPAGTTARAVAARRAAPADTNVAWFILELIAAGVSVAAAVLMGLSLYGK